MNAYVPRRCSKRWLDADCPRGVLAIMDHPNEVDRYTVFYVDQIVDESDFGRSSWLSYVLVTEGGHYYHGEMKAHEVAQYRYRQKHRYTTWSSLPLVVKNVVRHDLEEAEK